MKFVIFICNILPVIFVTVLRFSFADALERIINILALGQFVISTGLVCFAGFQITSVRLPTKEAL